MPGCAPARCACLPYRTWIGMCFLVLALALLAGSHAARAFEVRDARGETLRLEQAPQRIVSLLPSLTETVCALQQCQRLVGVDRYSNFPATVRSLPQVGGGMDPDVEAIVSLHPDLVLVPLSSRAALRLGSLGLRLFALEPQTHDELRDAFLKIGELLALPQAGARWDALDAEVLSAAAAVPPRLRGARVYFEASEGLYGAGAASFLGSTLERLGLRNILPPEMGAFPHVNPEYVVRANPDLILLAQDNVHNLAQRPGWSRLRALRLQQVCAFGPADFDAMVRPGPRLGEGARAIVACLRGLAP